MPELDRIYSEYYSRVYRDDAATRRRTSRFYRALFSRHLPPDRGIRLLDVGCGAGFALRLLRDLGYHNIHGLETNADQARAAQAALGESLVSACTSSTEWLARHRGAFGCIISTDVIEHVPPQEQIDFVTAIYGALEPGGLLLCTVPNASSAIEGRWRYLDFTHQSSFTETSLRFLLEAAGFDAITIDGAEIYRVAEGRLALAKDALGAALRLVTRGLRRLEMVAELGLDEGLAVPLTVNLLAIARKAQ